MPAGCLWSTVEVFHWYHSGRAWWLVGGVGLYQMLRCWKNKVRIINNQCAHLRPSSDHEQNTCEVLKELIKILGGVKLSKQNIRNIDLVRKREVVNCGRPKHNDCRQLKLSQINWFNEVAGKFVGVWTLTCCFCMLPTCSWSLLSWFCLLLLTKSRLTFCNPEVKQAFTFWKVKKAFKTSPSQSVPETSHTSLLVWYPASICAVKINRVYKGTRLADICGYTHVYQMRHQIIWFAWLVDSNLLSICVIRCHWNRSFGLAMYEML